MDRKFYAHSLPGKPKNQWQPLEEHLKNVGELARGFAEEFGAGAEADMASTEFLYLPNRR